LWLVGLVGLTAPGPAPAQNVEWEPLDDGLAVAVWEPAAQCHDDVPAFYLVRIDPEQFRFETYYYRDERLTVPPTIREWQERTKSRLLFNAGLFREDYSYMGLLFKGARSLGGKRHSQWQGLFVAEPVHKDLPKARVLDLAADPFPESNPPYREAAQSLMLLDGSGKPRVRQTDKRAHQTIVAEDAQGQILVLKTTDEVGLRALAECLRDRFPAIRRAMAMDGGSSSDLLVEAGLLQGLKRAAGARSRQSLVDGSGTAHIPLPAVIGIFPRREK
jgi:uncharacterized protein YigE (DUF2233 family)